MEVLECGWRLAERGLRDERVLLDEAWNERRADSALTQAGECLASSGEVGLWGAKGMEVDLCGRDTGRQEPCRRGKRIFPGSDGRHGPQTKDELLQRYCAQVLCLERIPASVRVRVNKAGQKQLGARLNYPRSRISARDRAKAAHRLDTGTLDQDPGIADGLRPGVTDEKFRPQQPPAVRNTAQYVGALRGLNGLRHALIAAIAPLLGHGARLSVAPEKAREVLPFHQCPVGVVGDGLSDLHTLKLKIAPGPICSHEDLLGADVPIRVLDGLELCG